MRLQPRRRRNASTFQIGLLKLIGYRYSHHRQAWVHRLLGGRHGPVFAAAPAVATTADRPGGITLDLREPKSVSAERVGHNAASGPEPG